MEVTCRFCQKPAQQHTISELEKIGVNQHWCEECQAEYLIWKDSEVFNCCSLYTNIKDKRYCWTTTATGRAVLWYIKTPGKPGEEIDRDREVLYSMEPQDNQPTITPENISQKIKTMLVFL